MEQLTIEDIDLIFTKFHIHRVDYDQDKKRFDELKYKLDRIKRELIREKVKAKDD